MKTRLLLLASFVGASLLGQAQANQSDSLALVEFYNKTQPKNGSWDRHKNWLTAAPLNDWYGITVTNTRVTEVSLPFNNIAGKLPPSFLTLTELRTLKLRGNSSLSIALSAGIAKLKKLTYLDLQTTGTTGAIPAQISQITKLEYLNISDCSLKGNVPSSIGNLKKLNTLILSESSLGGQLPESLGSLTALKSLDLKSNAFSGSLPAQGYWPNLVDINLNANNISGNLPGWLSASHSLYFFEIGGNDFSGPIPAIWRDSLPALYYFAAIGNHLSGPIPEWLLKSPAIDELELSKNEFSRQDNPCTVISPSLLVYDLSGNRYTFNGLECLTVNFGGFGNVNPQAPIKVMTKGTKLTVSAGGTLSNNTYNWYQVGVAQPVVIKGDSTYTPAQSGQYYARVSNAAVSRLVLTTDTVTYTKAAKAAELHLVLSPNPTPGQVTLYGLDDKADVLVRVSDMSGHVWLQATSRKQSMLKLNTSNLKAGNYFVAVSLGGTVKTLPLVKE